MFLSATLTYGVILLALGWWFWHVWRKASNLKVDPAEAAVFNVKNSSVKKNCHCEVQPCDCISNTQAKRAAKLAKSNAAPPPRRTNPVRKVKTTHATSPPAAPPPKSSTAPAHSSKQSHAEKQFNVIELNDDVSSDDSADEPRLSELPDRWRSVLQENRTPADDSESQEIEANFRKLSNTYNKLLGQRRKLRPSGESVLRRVNETNKFAVFDEAVSALADCRADSDDEEAVAEKVLKCANYSTGDKVELLKILIDDLEHELYRLGEQKPAAAPTAARSKPGRKAPAPKRRSPGKTQIQAQDYIPGLPANLMV